MRLYLARKLPAGYAAVPLAYKLFMLFGVIFVAIIFIYYTLDVVNQLKQKTKNDVRLYVMLYQVALSDQASSAATNLIFEEVISAVNFPIIFADSALEPQYWKELDGVPDGMATDVDSTTLSKVKDVLAGLADKGQSVDIISNEQLFYHMYYGDPKLVRQLQMMPFVEVGVIGIFILVGFIGFRNIKRAEQRNIWVGMAKETAHQLGTPLSGLLGWLQLLRSKVPDEPDEAAEESLCSNDIISRMENDVHRLERVANRFSLIGSKPALTTIDVDDILTDVVGYFRARLPFSGEGIRIEFERSNPKPVSVNSELIGWVVENIIKNALEACDPKEGLIRVDSGFVKDGGKIRIEIMDNGKGIHPKEVKKVFQPGYTTKKRGWGLGLALAKRIIADYHRGQIYVSDSSPGRGTTFRIDLPIANPNSKVGTKNGS